MPIYKEITCIVQRHNLEMIKLKNKYVNIQHDFKFDSGVLDYITLSFSNTYFKDVKNI